MNDVNRIDIPTIGTHFLAVADALVEARNLEALDSLHKVVVDIILENIAAEDISLVEISEYIEVACELFKAGKTPADAKESSIRKLLSE